MPATIRASCLIGGLREAPQCDSARLDDRRPGRDGTIVSPRRPPTLAVRAHLEARDIVLAHRAGVAIGEARRPRTPRIDEDGAGREAVRFAQETRQPGRLRLARLARLSRPCRIAGAGGAGSNGEGETRPHDDRDDASVHDLTSFAVSGGSEAIRHGGSTGFRGDLALSLIHISEPTRLGMMSYAVFSLK